MMASTTFQSPSTQHSTDSMNQPYLFASTDHSSSRRQQQAGNPIPTHSPRSGTTHPTNGRSTHGTPSVQSKVAAVGYSGSRLAQPFTAQVGDASLLYPTAPVLHGSDGCNITLFYVTPECHLEEYVLGGVQSAGWL